MTTPARKPPPDRPRLLVLPSADIADVLRDPCACRCECAHPTHCVCSPCAACAAEPRELEPMAGTDNGRKDIDF